MSNMNIEITNVLLCSPETIKSNNMLDCNVDDSMVSSVIYTAQNVYLRDIIGDKLLYKLQELVYNSINNLDDNINSPENINFKAFLDIYLKDVITYKVLSDLVVLNTLKIKNAGVVQLSDTNISTVSLNDLKYLKDYFDTYFNSALNRMTDYINNNKDTFKQFTKFTTECTDNKKYGNIGIWLG